MSHDVDSVREIAARAVRITNADQAEALVFASDSSLTRFANNHIHQNVAEHDMQVSVRAVLGKRIGVASTNRLDEESLTACCARAVDSARVAPEDPHFPGLPGPGPIMAANRADQATAEFGPAERAVAAAQLITPSAEHDLTAAGTIEVSRQIVGVANSLGVETAMEVTDAKATVLSMGADGGSGWASFAGMRVDDLDAANLGDEAAALALRSKRPSDLDPGDYRVVLAPDAVDDFLAYLSYTGFSAKAVAEERSFMTGREGDKVMSELITIVDDALSVEAMGQTFDYEGVPKQRVALIDRGVVRGPVTDSYWAARMGRTNTGHALPAPNSFGPLPLNLVIEPGDASIEDLIAEVDRGIYVTRFHYLNIEDPVRAVLTGMTRDGTFLIEGGKLTKPVKNLRFTQSAVEALDSVLAVGSDRAFISDEGNPSLVPALALGSFSFTGQTA